METLQVTHVSAYSAADTPRRALLTSNHLVRTLPPANERIRTPFSTSRRAATAPSASGRPVTAPGCPALLRPLTAACSRSESRATDVTSTRPVCSSLRGSYAGPDSPGVSCPSSGRSHPGPEAAVSQALRHVYAG